MNPIRGQNHPGTTTPSSRVGEHLLPPETEKGQKSLKDGRSPQPVPRYHQDRDRATERAARLNSHILILSVGWRRPSSSDQCPGGAIGPSARCGYLVETQIQGQHPHPDLKTGVCIRGGFSKIPSGYTVGYPSFLNACPHWGNAKGIRAGRKGYLVEGRHPLNFAGNAVCWQKCSIRHECG